MSAQPPSTERDDANTQQSAVNQDTVQAGLETPLGPLISAFGEEAVSAEVTAVALEELQQKREAITKALETETVSELRTLSKPALGYLRAMERVSEEATMEAFLAREGHSEIQNSDILRLWNALRSKSDSFARMVGELGLTAESIFDADEETATRIRARLEPRAVELRARQMTFLESYEPVLQGLMSAHSAGREIRDDIKVLAQVETFRDILNLLARELPSSRRSNTNRESFTIGAIASRYMPIVRAWRDLRLTLQGRINHWTDIQWNNSFDLDRGYPQVELRVFSYSREILYIRDDIDDVLRLAARVVARVGVGIGLLLDSGAKLDPDVIENVVNELRQLDESSSTLRQRLSNRTASTLQPQGTDRE